MSRTKIPLSEDPLGELRLLNQITQRINLGNSLDEVLDLIFERLREFIPCNRIAVALTDESKSALTLFSVRCDGAAALPRGYSGRIAGSSLEGLLRTGEPRVLNDLIAYLKAKPESESTRLIVKEGMRSSLTLPLLIEGVPVGVVFFSSRQPDTYRPDHVEFLRNIVGHVSIAVERSRLLDDLRAKSCSLENVLRNSADAIVVLDAEERIRTWSEGARRIFGYDAEEVLGRSFSMLVPPEALENGEYAQLQERAYRDGFVRDYDCVRVDKGGRRIAVNLTTTVLRDERGRGIGRSVILRDVTQLRRLQEELVRSRSLAAVGELAATVAHEIKNPLAGISGAVQVLEDAIPGTEGRRAVVAEILAQIRRLDKTVRDLLDFARPLVPARAPIDVREMLLRAWSLLAQQPGAHAVRFVLEGDGSMDVKVDPDLMHQVWLNLFQNAIESMPGGGEVRVRVTGNESVQVAVSDRGTGIDPSQRDRLFRPFFTTKTRGTGLGLAITRKIVEAHGGTIRLESVPSQGTTVLLEVPR